MRGKRIHTLKQLREVRDEKRAVYCPGRWGHPLFFEGPRPAAFMMNLSGEILLRLFEKGMYVYEKES